MTVPVSADAKQETNPSPRDLFPPGSSYRPEVFERDIGIPAGLIRTQFLRDVRQNGRPYYTASRGGTELFATEILDWAEEQHIPHAPTVERIAIYNRTHRMEEPSGKRSAILNGKGPIDCAEAALNKEATEAAQKKSAKDAKAFAIYVQIISRHEDASPGDAKALVAIMKQLDYSVADVRADLTILREAQALLKLYPQRASALEKVESTQEAYQRLVRGSEEAIKVARRAWRIAHDFHSECAGAKPKLIALCERRPELFDRDSDPPKLRKASDSSNRRPMEKLS